MLNWIHSHTTHLRPAVSLDSELVVSITSLKKGLLSSSSTCYLPNHGPAPTWNNLLRPGWKLNPGCVVIRVVADNNSIITGAPSKSAAITDMVLNVADDSSFRDGSEGQDVADNQSSFLPAEHELAGVHTFGGDKELGLLLVPEGVAEGDLGERSAAARVVDDLGDDALEVAVSLSEIEAPEPRRALAVVGVGFED